MIYCYECQKCGLVQDRKFPVADFPREVACSACEGRAVKMIEAPALVGLSSNRSKRNREMKKRNEEAGKRMRWSHKSLKSSQA